MRIGDLPAHDRDHVGLAQPDHLLGILRRADMAFGLHARMCDDLLQRRGVGRSQPLAILEGRHDAREFEIAAGAHRHVVEELALIVPGGDLLMVRDREHVGSGRIDADGDADDELLAAEPADKGQHRLREAHALFEAAAPGIVAAVAERRPELLEEGVVGRHDLDAVEAGRARAARRLAERLDEFEDLALAHRMAAVLIVHRGQARGRPVRLETVVPVGMRADMVELLEDGRALGMHRIGDASELRDHAIVRMAEVAAREDGGRMHRHRLDHDHRRPAARPLAVVAQMPLARQTVHRHVGRMRAEYDPVAQGEMAQGQRLEEVREHQMSDVR